MNIEYIKNCENKLTTLSDIVEDKTQRIKVPKSKKED